MDCRCQILSPLARKTRHADSAVLHRTECVTRYGLQTECPIFERIQADGRKNTGS
jgi:hypothetical protein